MVTFEDFNIPTLKALIKQYNLHLIIKNYSNLSKEKMIKKIEEHLYYDDFNKIALKPIAIRKLTDFLSKLKPIKLQPKIKPKKKKIESEIDTSNIKMKDVIKKVNNIITENKEEPFKMPVKKENYKIKFKKNYGSPIIQLGKEGNKLLKKMKEDDRKEIKKVVNDEKPLSGRKKVRGVIL